MSTYWCSLALASVVILLGAQLSSSTALLSATVQESDGTVFLFTWAPYQQAQSQNVTLRLHINSTTYYRGETVVMEGILSPGRLASILITIVLPDGSVMTRRVNTDTNGTFSFSLFLGSTGSFNAYALFVDSALNVSATSNVVGWVASLAPIPPEDNGTTQPNETIPSSGSKSPVTYGTTQPPEYVVVLLMAVGAALLSCAVHTLWMKPRKKA